MLSDMSIYSSDCSKANHEISFVRDGQKQGRVFSLVFFLHFYTLHIQVYDVRICLSGTKCGNLKVFTHGKQTPDILRICKTLHVIF